MTIDTTTLQADIERFFSAGADAVGDRRALDAFLELRSALSAGRVRAAEPDPGSALGWRVNTWVKKGILLGFRLGSMVQMGGDEFSFVDKSTYPARRFHPEQGVRVVPGGSAIREGAFLARGVVCMPPMYVNAGAYVDEGTMVDSHALVGSCASECRSADWRRAGAGQRHPGDH
jgi:2,3,4,5-tetrahydropyridine-2-carboxylate N-succinyltransferase